MEYKLISIIKLRSNGMSLVEVLIVVVLLSLSFTFFLKGLDTARIVRTTSELRTVQAVILNSLQQQIRSRRFDENNTSPWSTTLGPDASSSILSFDGVNDQILLGDINALDSPSLITISFWFNRAQDLPGNSNHFVSNIMFAKASDPENDNIEIGTDNTNVEIYIDSQSNDGPALTYNAGIQNNIWYHLVFTYNKNDPFEGRLYINGANVTSWNTWGGNIDNAGGSPVTVGNTNHIETPFKGSIKHLAIWSEALTSSEIMTIYNSENSFNPTINYGSYSSASGLIGFWKINEGSGTIVQDASGNNNPGTLLNGPVWSSSGTTEISILQWDDIDDFDNYTISSIPNNPTFSCSVAVKYVDPSKGFHLSIDYPTSYKSVIVKVFHPTISTMVDSMIISHGF